MFFTSISYAAGEFGDFNKIPVTLGIMLLFGIMVLFGVKVRYIYTRVHADIHAYTRAHAPIIFVKFPSLHFFLHSSSINLFLIFSLRSFPKPSIFPLPIHSLYNTSIHLLFHLFPQLQFFHYARTPRMWLLSYFQST